MGTWFSGSFSLLLACYGLAEVPSLPVCVADDPLFGPAIGLGQGRLEDQAFDLPPLNLALAHGLASRARFVEAASAEALADALVRVSQLVIDFPEIERLRFGGSAPAEMALRPPGQAGQLAIAPYPDSLVETWRAVGGEAMTIRPIRPEDAAAHAALFTRLSSDDIRYRFFSTLRELSAERIARMTQIDYDREMAFVAIRANGDTGGVARLVRDGVGSGEFAIVVEPAMRGNGLARHLMRRVIEWGGSHGQALITGQVLADNAPMLAFVRRLGFTLHHIPEERDVLEARMDLNAPA